MARSFILWLHGLGDSGPANEPIKTLFTSPQFKHTIWSFPSAPRNPVTANHGMVMPSWFDVLEFPVTAASPKDEDSLLKAVESVHAMIDKELAAGTDPKNVFVCGLSQGGALTLASVLLYPKTLGGGAIFSGWVPFNESLLEQIPADAKKTPFLWSHGTVDQTVLFEAGEAGPPMLGKAGVTCEFKAYPGLGHTITAQELRYLKSWIESRLQSSSRCHFSEVQLQPFSLSSSTVTKKLYRRDTVYPSPLVMSDHLSFLPAAIRTLVANDAFEHDDMFLKIQT